MEQSDLLALFSEGDTGIVNILGSGLIVARVKYRRKFLVGPGELPSGEK
jgi:hypothetical protein